MFIVRNRKIFFGVSGILIVLSIAAMSVWGFNLGIDFTGGSLTEVVYDGARPELSTVKAEIEKENLGGFSIRPTGDSGYVVRSREINETEKESLVNSLSLGGASALHVERFNSIGPVAGNELKNKSFLAIAVVIVAILLFIIFAFRKVSEPVASWKYGMATIMALVHDVIVPTGIFITLGHYFGMEIDLLFVAALLSIVGYSVHDTIVVFDRVRENLMHNKNTRTREDFGETVGRGLVQTMSRSINTSLTTILVLLSLFIFGGEATRNFSLVLLIGMITGTYSSIFLASPLLVLFAGKNK